MPRLPDGRIIQVCLNSLGVISRMNIGQLLEIHTGNVLEAARTFLKNNQNNTEKCIELLTKLFELLDGFDDKRLSKKMNSQLLAYNKNEQAKIIDYYIKNGVRMIIAPFEAPKLKAIEEAAKLVGTELESKVFLPEFNRWSMYPVTYGYIYMTKLEHISSIKQNVRSIGNYISTTMMPAKPGHHRNAIRIGEQDSWAYGAYEHGKEILREMFLVNGDNAQIKTDMIRKIETEGSADFNEEDYESLVSGSSTAFKVFSTVAGLGIK